MSSAAFLVSDAFSASYAANCDFVIGFAMYISLVHKDGCHAASMKRLLLFSLRFFNFLLGALP
jgi:hypothetical protein